MLQKLNLFLVLAVSVFGSASFAQSPADPIDLKYSFGPKPIAGFTRVQPQEVYNVNRGYGFDFQSKVTVVDRGNDDPAKSGYVTGENGRSFFFSAKLAAGAYQVTVTLGDATAEATTTVKSEARRLMLEAIHTNPGEFVTKTFLVHIRVPQIPGTGGKMVSLKAREKEPILYIQWSPQDPLIPFVEMDWDEKLTLEFSDHPAVCSVQITNAPEHTTIYLVGDSTMTDQMMEPWTAWGQMFPRWFKPPVLIANYAESGESAASFFGEQRWPKLMSEVSKGDYVLIQFGINDRTLAEDRIRQYFGQFIDDTRKRGAIPVLVTSQNLMRSQIGNYAEVMRKIAAEQNAPLIDLNAMSVKLYEAIGAEKLPKAFVDGTHHSGWGAYELSKCAVQAVIDAKLPWAQYVVEDWKPFDPSKPEPLESYKMPPDPQLDPARPGGPGAPGGRGGMAGDARGGGRGPARGARSATLPATQPTGR